VAEGGSAVISVILPSYNEEKSIRLVVEQLLAVLRAHKIAAEVIVVDDGSSDRTAEMISGLDVVLIQHEVNRGYGAALKTGLRHASAETVVIMDADGSYSADAIPDLVGAMDGAEMVVGVRTGRTVTRPLLRRFVKGVLTRLASYLVGRPIPDLNSGLRAFKRSVALGYATILPSGFSFTGTITLAMLNDGYNVRYIPIPYGARVGYSKFQPLKDTYNYLLLIIRTTTYFNPLKIFAPASLILWLLGLMVGLVSYFRFGRLADATTILLLVTGLEFLFFGILADLIVRRSR
jgi:glycosyltransferase involved in cell wall biosynthesis